MRRGATDTPVVAIGKSAVDVPFRLRLEPDDFQSYLVALRDSSTGQVVWRSGRLSAQTEASTRYVDVRIPAGLLKPQNYTFEMSGIAQGGAAQFVTSYAFRVVLE
jgi:hypothetical protein